MSRSVLEAPPAATSTFGAVIATTGCWLSMRVSVDVARNAATHTATPNTAAAVTRHAWRLKMEVDGCVCSIRAQLSWVASRYPGVRRGGWRGSARCATREQQQRNRAQRDAEPERAGADQQRGGGGD